MKTMKPYNKIYSHIQKYPTFKNHLQSFQYLISNIKKFKIQPGFNGTWLPDALSIIASELCLPASCQLQHFSIRLTFGAAFDLVIFYQPLMRT